MASLSPALPLLSVENLVVRFRTREGTIHAVNGVTFQLAEGERLGLVGESGCGKTVTNLALIQLLPKPAGHIEGGRVLFEGKDLTRSREDELRAIRGRDVAMIFQDPMTSLNPVLTIQEQMVETIIAHKEMSAQDATIRAIELLSMVGIPQPETRLQSFPHQFSGGMRQRVMIAMALALTPKLLIADEPTTALDVTIQAQVLELLRDLTEDSGSALILITHDLGVVAGMTNRINVMYAGFIVESATTSDLFAEPSHPYTVGLLHSIPRLDAQDDDPLVPIEGRPPDMRHAPIGCPFAPRCRWRLDVCWLENPALRPIIPDTPVVTTGSNATHQVACHNPPTIDEQAAGRPLRPGFVPSPPSSGIVDEVAADPPEPEHDVDRSSMTSESTNDPGTSSPRAEPLGAPAASPLLRVEGLTVYFPIRAGILRVRHVGDIQAVDGVTLEVARGETLGLVGESGCGKSTAGRAIVRLVEPTAGRVIFDGEDVTAKGANLLSLRRRMQMIFQDPYSSLDPRMTAGAIIAEPLDIHGIGTIAERREHVAELLSTVGLNPDYRSRYPHEFSGGQRQRIGVARALALRPELIVADEPISALDVSIQAQVINLLERLQHEMGLTFLFIAHDLRMVRHFSDRIAVMYLGRVVETAPSKDLNLKPLHPYTVALLSAIPVPDPVIESRRRRIILKGEVPSPERPPSGCRFHTRCWLRTRLGNPERCTTEDPALRVIDTRHEVACHFAEDVESSSERALAIGKPVPTAHRPLN